MSCTGSPELIQLHHSSQHTTQTENRTQKASTPILHQADREGRKKWSPPHLMSVWEKQAHTISVYHTHHLLVLLAFHSAVPMTLVHLALNLYSENKTRNPNTDQLRFMTVSHFLAGTCYGSGLQTTQIPQVSTASSWGYSQLFPTPVYYNATAKILFSALP